MPQIKLIESGKCEEEAGESGNFMPQIKLKAGRVKKRLVRVAIICYK